MRIMVLIGGMPVFTDSLSEDVKLRQEYLMRFASPGTEIEVIPAVSRVCDDVSCDVPELGKPAESTPGSTMESDSVETAVKGEKDGFDVIALHGG